MAQGERASRLARRGDEFWSRRPYFGEGKFGKILTHRCERRRVRSRELIERWLDEQRQILEEQIEDDLAMLGYENYEDYLEDLYGLSWETRWAR